MKERKSANKHKWSLEKYDTTFLEGIRKTFEAACRERKISIDDFVFSSIRIADIDKIILMRAWVLPNKVKRF